MITYDPEVITREQLLDVFFGAVHDASQVGGQGPDSGSRYRSMVLYSDEEQRADALAAIEHYSTNYYTDPIVTEVLPLERFWPAENFHVGYFSNNPDNPYCQMVVSPKLAKVRSKFAHLFE
jgi:peptide-methionine (S)-S-oxide reductase